MKKLVIAVMFGLSSVAMAETPVVDARNTSCADLQATLTSATAINVKGALGWTTMHYASDDQCEMGYRANISYVRAKDKLFCLSGYVCQKESDGN